MSLFETTERWCAALLTCECIPWLAAAITSGNNGVGVESDQFVTAGPFAKFFAAKVKTESQPVLSAETIKSEAKEILRCCLEGLSEEDLRQVPSLRLNYEDVMTAWSDRGEPWLDGKRSRGISDGDTQSDATVCRSISIQFPFVAVMGSQSSNLAAAFPFDGDNKSDRYAFGVERLHSRICS